MKPVLTHLAESALYVDDLERAITFYTSLFEIPVVRRNERFCALRINADQVLLLFLRGASFMPTPLPGGVVPPHDGHGPLHVCFGIAADDVTAWENHLREEGIPLESRMRWPSGAISLYFRDPDQHAVELATPGVFADGGES
jgi:catechol 2,3-dioxygenase-like lactoylglutathione lyase family enzyme